MCRVEFTPRVQCAYFLLSGIYLTCTMAITTLSMVLTVLVLNLHSISERPVPRWIKIFMNHYMARLFCKCDTPDSSRKDLQNHVKKRRKPPFGSSGLDGDDTEEQVPIIALNGSVNSGTGQETTSFVLLSNHVDRNSRSRHSSSQRNGKLLNPESEKPDYSKDWQTLAEVVDRLFFWTFLLAIVAISLLLFHPLTKDYIYSEPAI